MQDEQIEHLSQDNEKEFIKEINYTINVRIRKNLIIKISLNHFVKWFAILQDVAILKLKLHIMRKIT